MNMFERIENTVDNVRYLGLGLGLMESFTDNLLDDCDQLEKAINSFADSAYELIDFIDDPERALRDLTSPDESYCGASDLKSGDIVAVQRSAYWHYAVYIGDQRVIHFAPEKDGFGSDITIHEAPFSEFLRDAKTFDILEFGMTRGKIKRYKRQTAGGFLSLLPKDYMFVTELFRDKHYHLFSGEETVARAKMVAKEYQTMDKFERFLKGKDYNILSNNCEHFALWCKTGIHESRQVDKVLREISGWSNVLMPYWA